jgi:hypothetical protein
MARPPEPARLARDDLRRLHAALEDFDDHAARFAR